jgi:hypothetical protein
MSKKSLLFYIALCSTSLIPAWSLCMPRTIECPIPLSDDFSYSMVGESMRINSGGTCNVSDEHYQVFCDNAVFEQFRKTLRGGDTGIKYGIRCDLTLPEDRFGVSMVMPSRVPHKVALELELPFISSPHPDIGALQKKLCTEWQERILNPTTKADQERQDIIANFMNGFARSRVMSKPSAAQTSRKTPKKPGPHGDNTASTANTANTSG